MSRAPLLSPARLRDPDGDRHASWLELFFDLVFVAAVAAISYRLHKDALEATGTPWEAIGTALGLFVAVWWAWMTFTWYAAAFDNDDVLMRAASLLAMLFAGAIAASIIEVGGSSDAAFAAAYGLFHLVVVGLYLRSAAADPRARRYCLVYAAGNAIGAALWLVSVPLPEDVRPWLWALSAIPFLITPVLATARMDHPFYDAEHIPERYGLFTIIVLGESVVVATAALGDAGIDTSTALAGGAGFVLAAAVWWLYFGFTPSSLLTSGGGSLLTGFVWGYGHLLVFAGIAFAAVGVELGIEETAEAHDESSAALRATLLGGTLLFVLATAAIHWVGSLRLDATLVGRGLYAVALVVLWIAGERLDPRLLLILTAAGAVIVTAAEVARSAPRRGEPVT